MYAELEQKICSKCKKAKEKKEFSARTGRPSGMMSWCKNCHNEWRKMHRNKNRERYKQYEFSRSLKRHYKISVDQYNKMLIDQNGKCACCGLENMFKRRLHVDHDHKTGQIRALLCTQCNPGLGYFEHSKEKLFKAIKYLDKFKK